MRAVVKPFDNTDAIEAKWIRDGDGSCLRDPVQSVCLDIHWALVTRGDEFLLTDYEVSDPAAFFHFVFGGARGVDGGVLGDFLRIAPKGVWLKLYADNDAFVIEDSEGAHMCTLAL